MTERRANALQRAPGLLRIGPSRMACAGKELQFDIDEVAVPRLTRLQGTVRLRTPGWTRQAFALDPAGRHQWSPLAPCARVEVDFARPRLRWSGHAYLDSNGGDEPLDRGFSRWQWARATLRDGTTLVLYDVAPRGCSSHAEASRTIALQLDGAGSAAVVPAPPLTPLPATFWGIERAMRSDAPARLVRTLENAPFYARSLVAAHLAGEAVTAVHESLSLDRFRQRWVQCLLPFRMPRR